MSIYCSVDFDPKYIPSARNGACILLRTGTLSALGTAYLVGLIKAAGYISVAFKDSRCYYHDYACMSDNSFSNWHSVL